MALWMTPIGLPGTSIRPPNSPPGSKNIAKKKKPKSIKRKPQKRTERKITR